MQFFSSYGIYSYAVVLLELIGFIFFGRAFMKDGFEHKNEADFNQYEHYCGKTVGAVYTWVVPLTLFLASSVLLSACGASLYEYYGINKYLASGITAAFVLCSYLIGFEKMVNIVSKIGPVIIAFSVFIGIYTVVRDYSALESLAYSSDALASSEPCSHWIISAVLYLSMTFIGGSTYYTALGKTASSRKNLELGAVVGACLLMLSILFTNTAILVNAGDIAQLDVPTLYLADKISHTLGIVFSVILALGIFSSCSTIVWTYCSRFFKSDIRKNRIFASAAVFFAFLLSLFPFGKLMAAAYPIVGYTGLLFMGCVRIKRIKGLGSVNSQQTQGQVSRVHRDASLDKNR